MISHRRASMQAGPCRGDARSHRFTVGRFAAHRHFATFRMGSMILVLMIAVIGLDGHATAGSVTSGARAMTTRRLVLISLLAPWLCIFAADPAASQQYPNRLIKMIVPFPPGGPIDTMARLVAQQLSSRLGQEVVIDNRPGAGSTLGAKAAAGAEPDGYTLLFGSSGSLAVAPALYTKLNLDPLKMFAPVASV